MSTKGDQAMWHLNQAISLASETLASATRTPVGELMDPTAMENARAAWDALRKMAPIALDPASE